MAGESARAREAMIEYLKSDSPRRPLAVTLCPSGEDTRAGFITSTIEDGSLLLKNAKAEFFRLDWSKDDRNAKDRRRAVPAGKYTLTNYRAVRKDKDGAEWFLSASGPDLQEIEITAGREQKIEIDDRIILKGEPKRQGDEVHLHLGITGGSRGGLSIYRNGKRIEIPYALRDSSNKLLAVGTMKYG